ncbi:HN1_G0049300.mRNA.1.CDS.1 [Saccharomyces cerevisiae]|nr:HN1_G0049300.mRNA.1.CDS.1 [Saccharomyces cerevisiae]CAI4238579.1 BAL_1a_G0000750.mRNA.1.CDS.1 [Saccharomyces cerevisiae]CAI7035883.1 BAL_1a_G0000750.mRNA.1.CDS.1 [Saccharomyces cerevisiae]
MIFHDSVIYTISIISSGIALVFSTMAHLYFLVPINDVSSKMKLLLKGITHKLAYCGTHDTIFTVNETATSIFQSNLGKNLQEARGIIDQQCAITQASSISLLVPDQIMKGLGH